MFNNKRDYIIPYKVWLAKSILMESLPISWYNLGKNDTFV